MAALGIVCFVFVFMGVQFFRWSLHLMGWAGFHFDVATLPLPLLVMAGGLLAIAANSSKHWGGVFDQPQNSGSLADQDYREPSGVAAEANIPTTPIPPTSPVTLPLSSAISPASTVSYRIDPSHHLNERRPS